MQSLRVPWSLWMKIVRVPMSSLESRKENQGFLDGQSWHFEGSHGLRT